MGHAERGLKAIDDTPRDPRTGYPLPFIPSAEEAANFLSALGLTSQPSTTLPTPPWGPHNRSSAEFKLSPDVEEHWRPALENYVPAIKRREFVKLNEAAMPFAWLIVQIHERIHPLFTCTFLKALDELPSSDPMNRLQIYRRLELVIDGESGRILRLGIVKSSGFKVFDVATLESVSRAPPLEPPPRETISDDGNVYVHWDLHRDVSACSSLNARPFLFRTQPSTAPEPGVPDGPVGGAADGTRRMASPLATTASTDRPVTSRPGAGTASRVHRGAL